MTLEDDSWLEGRPAAADAVTIPVHGLTKRELAAAFNVPLKAIDKWTREGLPCRSTGSNRGGLRFDLPVAIEWRAAQREAEAAGDTTGTLADAKRRIALAQARRIELENAKEEGRLLQTETVSRYCEARYFAFRARLYGVENELFGLSAEHREQIRTTLDSALNDIAQIDFVTPLFEQASES